MRYNVIREYLQKLKNKKGSALLVSLLFSVISIIIATVILNAAVTSSRRVTETAESSQPYYLVSSLFSVFEYEASSPRANGSVNPDSGMGFTADLVFDSSKSVEELVLLNVPVGEDVRGELVTENVTDVLEAETNLETLTDYFAFCLVKAMLSGETAGRDFIVTVGGNGESIPKTYQIRCSVSVNPVDYTALINVTGINDITAGADDPVPLGLPEVCTLAFPTEKVEILEMQDLKDDGGLTHSRPTKAKFTYQRAKYISTPES